MTLPPLKRMNPRTVTADLFAALGEPLPSPLKRMSKPLVIKLANDIIVASGGTALPRGSSFADTAAALKVVYEETQGGDRPDWVPANAVIHIDLVRAFNDLDAAWTAVDGVVAIDTLLGNSAAADSGWGAPTAYDPDDLTGNGYVSSTALALIGSAGAKMLAGSTFRIVTKQVSGPTAYTFTILADDAGAAVEVSTNGNSGSKYARFASWNGPTEENVNNILNVGVGAINVVAGTFVGARIEGAANGSDPVDAVMEAGEYASLDASVLDGFTECALQAFTIYDPLPSTAGLSALSETGVP